MVVEVQPLVSLFAVDDGGVVAAVDAAPVVGDDGSELIHIRRRGDGEGEEGVVAEREADAGLDLEGEAQSGKSEALEAEHENLGQVEDAGALSGLAGAAALLAAVFYGFGPLEELDALVERAGVDGLALGRLWDGQGELHEAAERHREGVAQRAGYFGF